MSNLQRLRQERGYTQKGLSELTGLSIETIRAFEQGKKDIFEAKYRTLLLISNALKCNITDLLQS